MGSQDHSFQTAISFLIPAQRSGLLRGTRGDLRISGLPTGPRDEFESPLGLHRQPNRQTQEAKGQISKLKN
jgi:hypothetical protein